MENLLPQVQETLSPQCKMCQADLVVLPGGHRRREFCKKSCSMYFHRLKKLGITPEQWRILKKQGCGVCQKKGRLVRDHDHHTGAFRGVLCNACNTRLFQFWDDAAWQRAAQYLECAATANQFTTFIATQACPICQRQCKTMCIDRSQGYICGLLCGSCKGNIRFCRKDPTFIVNALTYLRKSAA